MKANELTANPHNPRTITDERLAALRNSMQVFGDLSGLIRNVTSGHLVGGHQRVKILDSAPITITQTYKKPTKQGTVAEGYVEFGGERYTYREVKWDKEKETAAMIAANRHGGEFLLPNLKEILSELDTGNFDMELTGYSMAEIESMMTAAPPEGADFKFKERKGGIPILKHEALVEKWKPEKGQLWQVGPHRLLIDDLFDPASWDRVGDAPYKFGFADPPYELTYSNAFFMRYISGDFFTFLGDAQAAAIGSKNFVGFFVHVYEATQGVNALRKNMPMQSHTLIAHLRPPRVKSTGSKKGLTSVFRSATNHAQDSGYQSLDTTTKHIKPLEIMETLMRFYAPPKSIIMDAFAGSGATMIAASNRGLSCRSIEINPAAAAVYLERAEVEAGLKPELIA